LTQEHVTRFGIILAGGAGERFWPLSRAKRPKQLLNLTDPNRCMLQEAVDRLAPIVPREQIYVITGHNLVDAIREAKVGLPDANVVAEPARRNTAGALCYITAHILATHPTLTREQVSLAVLTADHRIGDEPRFQATIRAAMSAAETQDALAVCGIEPRSPETGFGYIEADASQQATDGEGVAVSPVKAFHEKPGRARAEAFIATGSHFWNSGMFFWTASTFLSELRAARPEMASVVEALVERVAAGDDAGATTAFESLENISIDYALMEKASRVLMVAGTFPWGDVGLWPALADVYPQDADSNACVGDPILVNAEGCVVYNAPGNDRMAVGVAGIKDAVVVVTQDAVLVVHKDHASDVREIVAALKERGASQL